MRRSNNDNNDNSNGGRSLMVTQSRGDLIMLDFMPSSPGMSKGMRGSSSREPEPASGRWKNLEDYDYGD